MSTSRKVDQLFKGKFSITSLTSNRLKTPASKKFECELSILDTVLLIDIPSLLHHYLNVVDGTVLSLSVRRN